MVVLKIQLMLPFPIQPPRRLLLDRFTLLILVLGFQLVVGEWLHAETLPNYHREVWGTENGLPQGAVASIEQTHDGYLWFATYGGLARFDGVRFVVFDSSNTPELASSRITSLFVDQAGTLWIGQETGDLARYDPGAGFKAVGSNAHLDDPEIYAIKADEKNDIWFLTSKGLMVRPRDGLVVSPARGGGGTVVCLGAEQGGRLWVSRNGAASFLKDGVANKELFGAPPGQSFVQGVCGSKKGGAWIVADLRVRRWQDNHVAEEWGPVPNGTKLRSFFVKKSLC